MTHKNRIPLIVVLITVVGVVLFLSSEIRTSRAQVCGSERGCYTDFFNTCIPLATSLKPVNIHSAGDWYVEADNLDGHCGAKRYLFILAKPCGPPLSARLCTSGEKNTL